MLELADKRQSNVFQDGTDNNPIFLDSPNWCWVPNEGMRLNGSKMEKIRYLENDTSISVEDQDLRKVVVDRTKNKIIFEKGYAYLYKSESTEQLIEFLTTATYCKSAPRPINSGATVLYDIVNLSAKAEQANEGEEEVVEALSLLYKLRSKVEGKYVYNEAKIESYANLLSVYGGQSPAENFKALNDIAKAKPKDFVAVVSAFDNTVKTEVAQALELKVISFADGIASFTSDDKVIKQLGSEAKNKGQQIEVISDFLKTSEGTEFLTKMRALTDAEKQKKSANK